MLAIQLSEMGLYCGGLFSHARCLFHADMKHCFLYKLVLVNGLLCRFQSFATLQVDFLAVYKHTITFAPIGGLASPPLQIYMYIYINRDL